MFESYLVDPKHSASINSFNSNITTITSGAPQGSIIGPMLLLIYKDELNLAIKHCKDYHFADDTNLLNINKSHMPLNKRIKIDLENLTKQTNANIISMYCSIQKVWTSILNWN